jgi:AmmeMemoRadiSam system protein A
MDALTLKDRNYLLDIARKTIEKESRSDWLSDDDRSGLSPFMCEKRGGFVTIHKSGSLRGCIGYILPVMELYRTVIENAYNAAYNDPRFPPLTRQELEEIDIEISILSVPKKLEYKGVDDLLGKLHPGKDGIIIKKGGYSATFLPQVWEQLPEKRDFLEHLCMKAGLSPREWETGSLDIEHYSALVIEEKEKV